MTRLSVPMLAVRVGLILLAGSATASAIAMIVTPIEIPSAQAMREVASRSQPADVSVFDSTPFSSLHALLKTPAFDKRRGKNQPQTPAAGNELPQRIEMAAFDLLGIFISSGARRALIRTRGETAAAWVAEGEDIAGWSLSHVSEKRALLVAEGRQQELLLYQPTLKQN